MSLMHFFMLWGGLTCVGIWRDAEKQKKKIKNILDRFLANRIDRDPNETRNLVAAMERWMDAQ